MVQMTHFVETQVKLCGLNQEVFSIFQQYLTMEVAFTEGFAQKILSYLTQEIPQIILGRTLQQFAVESNTDLTPLPPYFL